MTAVSDPADQAEDYEPPTAYVQFPFNYHKRVDLRRIHRKWPHTTLWLLSVCVAAKDARANGALRVGGCPITPEEIDAIECWEPIKEGWVHDMIAAGLFAIDPKDGAVIVACRRQFIAYDSDSPASRRERQAKSRAGKKAGKADKAAKQPQSASPPGRADAPACVYAQPAPAAPHADLSQNVTTGHEQVTSGHESVTNCHDASRMARDIAVTGHEMSRAVTAGHDTIQFNPIQSNTIQSKSIQSIAPLEEASDRANERYADVISKDLGRLAERVDRHASAAVEALTEAFGNSKEAQRAIRRVKELIPVFVDKQIRTGYTVYEACTAVHFAGLASAWAHRDGPGVGALPSHFSKCCTDWLQRVHDREMDREACLRDGDPDPGSLEWIPPDVEVMDR